MIDRQILSTAHKVLGDFQDKILLSLPPKHTAGGEIHLGTIVYEEEKYPFGISRGELLQHLGIFGRSGAGKSNVVFHILDQLTKKNIPWLFFDWKRTARHVSIGTAKIYTPGRSLSPFLFNPFLPPPGLEKNTYVNHLIDIISDAYTLGDGARSMLRKAITSCYEQDKDSPTLTEVLRELEKLSAKGRGAGWKMSATRALESIQFSEVTAETGVSQEEIVRTLVDQNTIIELNGLDQGSKKLLVPLLALWIFYLKLASRQREKLQLVLVLEEAHHLLYGQQRSKETVMEMVLRQCRELGLAVIVVDQHPSLISRAALGNLYTSICLNQKAPTDVSKAAALSSVNENEKKYFGMLAIGQGIVKLQGRWNKPFLVEFPLVKVKKGAVSDELLRSYLQGSRTLSGLRRAVAKEYGGERRFRILDTRLEDKEFVFLEDVLEHRQDGVDKRYRRLGWSGDKGNKVKNKLLDDGILEAEEVKLGRTRKVLLRVTSTAKQELGVGPGNMGKESIAHEFWKRFYAAKFRELGYEVKLEAPRRGGRVDVLARKGSESVAIEVETGKSDVVGNVKKCLLSGSYRVLVVATDETARNRVEKELGKAGLIIPRRVMILIGDQIVRDSKSL